MFPIVGVSVNFSISKISEDSFSSLTLEPPTWSLDNSSFNSKYFCLYFKYLCSKDIYIYINMRK